MSRIASSTITMAMNPNNCCVFEEISFSSVLPPVLVLEFILGVLGNSLALWIFCFHLKPWRTSTVLLFNLALADLLLNVTLPFRANYYQRGRDWIFGDVLCRISLFMLALNRSGSILFLTAVTVDRYLRVVHPHHPFISMSVRKAAGAACVLCALTISQTAHLMFNRHLIKAGNLTQCESFRICNTSNFKFTWHKSVFGISFYLPLAVILFCSVRIVTQLRSRELDKHSRIKKTLHFIALVVVIFFLCFFPSNLTQLVIWAKRTLSHGSCDEYRGLETAFFFIISLTYLNSMLDPIVYYFYSPTFKRVLKKQVITRLGITGQTDTEEEET